MKIIELSIFEIATLYNMTKNDNKFRKDLLRIPGQSVDEMIESYMNDRVDPDISSLLFAVVLLSLVLLHSVYPIFDQTWVFSFVLLAVIGFFTHRILYARKKLRKMYQGRDGERYVGQLLEKMRVDGHVVFHDLKAEQFNVDHVVVGPQGIYVIETKTWSKLPGKSIASYKNGRFMINGKVIQKNPLEQAKKNSKWLHGVLKESTGKSFSIIPVVVMPDWFIEPGDTKNARADGVIFVNPKALPAFVKGSTVSLPLEDVHLTAYHIEMYAKHMSKLANN